MKSEVNLSDSYRRDVIEVITKLSKYHNNRSFKEKTRDDILSYLDSFRKPEASDPLHKWIGTYNLYGYIYNASLNGCIILKLNALKDQSLL